MSRYTKMGTNAVILVAGAGERLKPLSNKRPKAMMPVANKPLLGHLVCELKGAGVREIIMVINYYGNLIEEYFGKGKDCDVSIKYVYQTKCLGTAHALGLVKDFCGERFLVINGDILVSRSDIKKFMTKNSISIAVFEDVNCGELGTVSVINSKVKAIYEKDAKKDLALSNLVNVGLYTFTSDVFAFIQKTPLSPRGEYELTNTLQLLINKSVPVTWEKVRYWLHLSHPWDLLTMNEFLLKRLRGQNRGLLEDNVCLGGVVSIGPNSVIRSGSYILGPTIIGANCEIGPNCYIRPSTSIGDNCYISHGVEIKNSIIMKNTRIPHHTYVGDSVIGECCNLGAGTNIANARLDMKFISIAGITTRRNKLGVIMGDNVRTGINACINPGTIVGNDTIIGPQTTVKGIIPPYSCVFK